MPPILTDKPEPTDILANSQVDLQNDMEYLQHAFNKDHIVAFNEDSNSGTPAGNQQGRHKQVSFNNRSFANIAVPTSMEGILHVFNENLYWRSGSLPGSVKMTNVNVGVPVAALNGYSFLPGGLMIAWGEGLSVFPGVSTVIFPLAFSAAPYSVTATIFSAGNTLALQVNTITAADFTFQAFRTSSNVSQNNTPIKWIAIGPK